MASHPQEAARQVHARHQARANAKNSTLRARVEHCFGHQNSVMSLVVRVIGRTRAEAGITLTNMVYNMNCWCWLDRRSAPA